MSRMPLICFPFAGAGASFFRPWKNSTLFDVLPLSLPGREKRFIEPAYRDVAAAIDGVLPEVHTLLAGREQAVVFGHSMGAVLAFELTRRLLATTPIQVVQLVVSGSPGPWTPREQQATGLSDDGFLQKVREFAGYDHPALNNPDMRAMLLPTLRADVELHESYRPATAEPLPVRILAVRGSNDELVTPEQAAQWQQATTEPLKQVEIPGGHMYLSDHADLLLETIDAGLAELAVGSSDAAR